MLNNGRFCVWRLVVQLSHWKLICLYLGLFNSPFVGRLEGRCREACDKNAALVTPPLPLFLSFSTRVSAWEAFLSSFFLFVVPGTWACAAQSLLAEH